MYLDGQIDKMLIRNDENSRSNLSWGDIFRNKFFIVF